MVFSVNTPDIEQRFHLVIHKGITPCLNTFWPRPETAPAPFPLASARYILVAGELLRHWARVSMLGLRLSHVQSDGFCHVPLLVHHVHII